MDDAGNIILMVGMVKEMLLKTNGMDKLLEFFLQEMFSRDNGLKVNVKDKVNIFGLMVESFLENIKMIRDMG